MSINKFKYTFLCAIALGILSFSSCDVDTVENPNGPTLESLENGATLADLRLLASGLESVMRTDMEFYYQTVSIVGREYYDLNGIDPRYTGELLGEGSGEGFLDNNGFLTTRSFAARYRAVRNAWTLITAVENSNASLSTEQINGFIGYAKTMQAYALLLVANRQYENGIRSADAVRDPDNLGSFTNSHAESLGEVSSLLDEAAGLLSNAGDDFLFSLSSGFSGFDTPTSFRQFNRAIAARVAIYQNNKSKALGLLNDSFLDENGGMNMGVYHAFGSGGNDIRNPLFYVPNTDLYTVQCSWVDDAESGPDGLDSRVDAKSTPLDPGAVDLPVVISGLSSDPCNRQVSMFSSNIDPFPIIRNEELILLFAEANIGTDNGAAEAAINKVRAAAGLFDYSGGTDDASLLDEVIHQRRYSLFGEGHRWVDMRRVGRLNELPLDRDGDQVFEQFPRPVTEG